MPTEEPLFFSYEGIVQSWRPTGALRWLDRAPIPLAFTGPLDRRALQQEWACIETGEREWRDVPTEREPAQEVSR